MHIPRLYIPQPLFEHTLLALEPAAAHHIAKVLRMKAGRSIRLFNGQANASSGLGEFSATLHSVDKKNVIVSVGEFISRNTESPLSVELGVCLIKNDRMDWLLQKATELGVTTITPLWSEYTDVKIPVDRLEKKFNHWQQVIINACEQSGRVAIPVLNAPQKIAEWSRSVQADKKYVLHPYVESAVLTSPSLKSIAVLVGPEGGLSDEEVDLAKKHHFSGLALGQRILRAETAPLAALSILQYQHGDFTS